MAFERAQFKLAGFRGIDQSIAEEHLSFQDSPDAQNIDTSSGNLCIAKGYSRWCITPLPRGALKLMKAFRRQEPFAGSHLLAATDEGLYRYTGIGWLRIGDARGERACFLNYQKGNNDTFLYSDGTYTYQWDGNHWKSWTIPVPFTSVGLHVERVWGSGADIEPDAVYWSSAYDPENYQNNLEMPEAGGGFLHVPTWNGGRIEGIAMVFGDVLVLKSSDLFRIYGTYPGDYQVARIHGQLGTRAPRTVVEHGSLCYLWGDEGLCVYDGVYIRALDRKMQTFAKGIDPDSAWKACAIVYQDQLLIALPEKSTHNNAVLVYNIQQGTYMVRRGVQVTSWIEFEGKLLFTNERGRIYVWGEGDDYDGTPILAYWCTPWTHFDECSRIKWFGSMTVQGEGMLKVRYSTERGTKQRCVPMRGQRASKARMYHRGRRVRLKLCNVAHQRMELWGLDWQMEMET